MLFCVIVTCSRRSGFALFVWFVHYHSALLVRLSYCAVLYFAASRSVFVECSGVVLGYVVYLRCRVLCWRVLRVCAVVL